MNNRRDEQYERQPFGRHNAEYEEDRDRDFEGGMPLRGGRGQDDWRSDSQRGREGGMMMRGGGMRGSQGEGRFSDAVGGVSSSPAGYGYGYGEGMRGGYSYGQRRWSNESTSNARGYGVGSAFESGGSVQVSHRGKGPKGFKRSDDRIRENVSEVLADHHEIDATEIEVAVKDGEVTLSGTVTDRRTKRLAEHVIENVSGVLDVHNTIRVVPQNANANQPSAPVAQGRSNGNQTTPQSPRSQH